MAFQKFHQFVEQELTLSSLIQYDIKLYLLVLGKLCVVIS